MLRWVFSALYSEIIIWHTDCHFRRGHQLPGVSAQPGVVSPGLCWQWPVLLLQLSQVPAWPPWPRELFPLQFQTLQPVQPHQEEGQELGNWQTVKVLPPRAVSKAKIEYLAVIMWFQTSTAKFLWAAQMKKGTACNFKELHASSCNCMQAYVTACKLM